MTLRLRGRIYPDSEDVGHMPLWLLAYLGFLALPWLLGSTQPLWPTLLAIGLFLPLYFRSWWLTGPSQLLCAFAIALIGYALLPYNFCAHTFVIYACAVAGLQRQARVALVSVALILLLFVALCRWLDLSPVVDAVTLIVGMAVAAGNHIQQQQVRRQAILRLSQIEVENLARLAERERIGRDLHDLLGHTLSVIALKSDLARRLSERDPARARQEIVEVERIAREGLSQVRTAVTGIRAAGLRTELARVRLMLEAADLSLQAELSDEPLPVEVETALAFVLREACTNVVRHARASKVQVQLHTTTDQVRLRVRDDGRGGIDGASAGNGLRGLRERIEQLGGRVALQSARQDGTLLEVCIPLQPSSGLSPQLSALPS
jgi:two-component system sensor histidine kinase DesK